MCSYHSILFPEKEHSIRDPGVVYLYWNHPNSKMFSCVTLGIVAAVASPDPYGKRAAELQDEIIASRPGTTILLSGTYNFSTQSLLISGKTDLTLTSSTPHDTDTLFLFGYKHDGRHSDEQGIESIQPGVNITNSESVSILGATIDYQPKAPILFCPCPRCPDSNCSGVSSGSGPGITLHMFNSSDTLIEDITIHAAPYMVLC